MSICNIRCTCPEWIVCPRKPHQFGNEWHTSCCVLSGILFIVESVEVKEHPHQASPLEFEYLGRKTVELLLHIMKMYFATGRYVIIDSGLCVLKGLIQLMNEGIFHVP